jgi:hypothetical protein
MTVQNLNPGRKDASEALSKGDKCDFQVFTWIVEDDLKSFGGQIKNGDPVRIEIGSNEWNESLQGGMKLEGSKVIILTSNKLGSEMGNCPSNGVVALKLKLVKKLAPETPAEVPNKESEKVTDNKDDQAKVTENVDDQAKVSETKARIERLVSKVGQPVMIQPKEVLSRQKDGNPKIVENSNEEVMSEQNGNSIQDGGSKQGQPLNETISSPKPNPPPRRSNPFNPANPDSDNLVRMIFSEQRLQNADMRMSIKRLEDKLDDLLNKLIPSSSCQDQKPIENGSKLAPNQFQTGSKDDESLKDVDKVQQMIGELELCKKTVEQLTEQNKSLEDDLKKSKEDNSKLKDDLEASNRLLNEKHEKVLAENISLKQQIDENQKNENIESCSKEEEKVLKLREEIEKSLTFQSEELMKKNVRKIVNKTFKSVKSEMESSNNGNSNKNDDNEVILKQIAFHLRNATDQLLNENDQS